MSAESPEFYRTTGRMRLGSILVTVHPEGFLRWIADRSDIGVVVSRGASVAEVIVTFAGQVGEELRKAVLKPDGTPYPGIVVRVEGKAVPHRELSSTFLRDDCVVTLVPVAAGG